jgi:hypothetical protein
MNWIKFSFWLAGIYTLYYAVLIFWDQWKEQKASSPAEENVLTFVEHVEPQKTGLISGRPRSESPIVSSGGVTLKQMFSLAQQEAIEFTRPVSFA